MSVLCHLVSYKLKSILEKHSDICHWELLQESEYCPCLKGPMHMDVNQSLRYIQCTSASPESAVYSINICDETTTCTHLNSFSGWTKASVNKIMHMLFLNVHIWRIYFVCSRSVLSAQLSPVQVTFRRKSKNNFEVKFSQVKKEKACNCKVLFQFVTITKV